MGVRGLLSTCLERRDECTETADLVQVASDRDGIQLLVDYYAFQQEILAKFWAHLIKLTQNDYLRLLGGEYGTFDSYLTKLIENLKASGISLVFYIDGSKGSSAAGWRQKLDTWMSRHEQDIKKLSSITDVCCGKMSIEDLALDTNIRPVVLEDQVMSVLKKCGCEVNQNPAGEADLIIARALLDKPKAYAVLSNDSDFCIFKDCRFIPYQLFDLENDLQLDEAVQPMDKPQRLNVKVITTEKVMSMLKFSNPQLLIELSIVAGNDFTGQHMRPLHQRLDIQGRRSIYNFSGWVNHYKNVQNHQVIDQEMYHNHGLRDAIYHSRNFYSLKGHPDMPPNKGYFSKLIEEGIRSGRYPCNIMGIHNGLYWYRMLLEDDTPGAPCIEATLAILRAYIYRIVLPNQEQQVIEYGRSPYDNMREARIYATDDGRAPALNRIQSDKIFNNLRHFHAIMTHLERGNCTTNWFDRYGRKAGFTIYLLRYFLHLNWGQNLHITENEYLALVAMVFGHRVEAEYQIMAICPTVRCVTIGNWFQDVYRHAYSMLGSLLCIKHEFPLPSELLCGSVWTAMYMVSQDATFRQAADQVPLASLYKTQEHMNAVLKEKRFVIRHIVEGFFPFET